MEHREIKSIYSKLKIEVTQISSPQKTVFKVKLQVMQTFNSQNMDLMDTCINSEKKLRNFKGGSCQLEISF